MSAVALVTGCGNRLPSAQIRSAGGVAQTGAVQNGGGGAATTTGTTGAGALTTSGSGTTGGSTTTGGGATSTGGTTSTGGSSTTGGTTTGAASTTGGGKAPTAATGADAPIFGGGAACTAATGSTINIGNVSTLSGVLGQLFQPVVPALQTFVKSQNACGGLNGHPIKLFIEDDQGDPSTAVSAAQDEIQNNKILAFVGNIQVLTIDAMVSVVNKSGIPIIGGDLTNNTWFTNPLIFPQGSPPQAISYGYIQAATKLFNKKKLGDVYCLEVPQACQQIDKAYGELAPKFGADLVSSTQVSITAPSYTSQCLDAQKKGVEVMALTVDAPTQNRYANSCAKVGFKPQYIAYPLGVGNEKQFLGNPNLGNTYVPLNTFAWMANSTPAEKYYQSSVAKYNPGFTTGDAAGLGWTAGALLVAASSKLTATPATSQFLDALYTFKGQTSTTLGGLTAPLTFTKGANPKVPYCLFAAISNANNSGWATPISKAVCTNVLAPSDPQGH